MKHLYNIFFTTLIALIVVQPLFADKYAPKRIPVRPGEGENTIFIYRNDNDFHALFDNEVDSITFSNFDEEFNHYDYPVMQYVYARDTCFVMSLEVVDSIGFRTPDIIYKKGVIDLDEITSRFVVAFDSLSVTFAYNTPAMFMPEPGNVLYCPVPNDVFVNPLAAKVESVADCGFGVRCMLDYCISPGDIFDQYISAGSLQMDEDPEGNKMLKVRSSVKKGLSCEELRNFLKKFAGDLNIKLTLDGAPWNDDGLKVGIVLEKGDSEKDKIYGSFESYLRLLLKNEDKIDGKDNLSRFHAGVFIGTGLDLHAQFGGSHKFIDPDDYKPPTWVTNAARIPIAGTPFFVSFNPFRPLVEVSGKLDLNLSISGEVGYEWVWLLDWDAPLSEFATFDSSRSGFKKDWSGNFVATGNADLFIGFVPEVKLSVFSDNICSIKWEGKIGAVAKATIPVDAAELSTTTKVSNWSYDKREKVTEHYRNILSNADKTGVKFGPRMNQSIKIDVLKGLFDEITLFDSPANDPDYTSQLPVIGGLLPNKPLSFRLPWTPEIKDIKMEHIGVSSFGELLYRVSYRLSTRSLGYHTPGLVLIDHSDGDHKLVCHLEGLNDEIKPLADYSKAEFYNTFYLKPGHHYIIYPVMLGLTDEDVTWCYPYVEFIASPEVTTGKAVTITGDKCRIDNNQVECYDSGKKVIGIAYVNAGTLNTNDPSEVKFNNLDPKQINIVMLSEEERMRYYRGYSQYFSATIPNLLDGCKYFYAAFYTSQTEEEFKAQPRIDRFGDTYSFRVPGEGLTVYNIDKCDPDNTMMFVYGCIEWNPKGGIMTKSMDISLLYRREGATDWLKTTISGEHEDIKNGVIFKTIINNLLENVKYEYKWDVEYFGKHYESSVRTAKTEKSKFDGNFDNLIKSFKAEFVSSTSFSATFRIMADWRGAADYGDLASVGVAYCRRKVKYGAPHAEDLVFDVANHKMAWSNEEGATYMYQRKRGEWVYLTITGLKPEDSKYLYYWRPYLVLHTDAIQHLRNTEDEYDFTNYWDLSNGTSFRMIHGDMRKFNTRGKDFKDSEINFNETSGADCSNGMIYWGLQNTGMKRAKNAGVLISPKRSMVFNCDQTVFVRGNIITNSKDAPERLRALNKKHRQKMQSKLGAPMKAGEEDDDDDAPVFDVLMQIGDYSKLSIGETYYVRSMFQSVDDQYYFSDITEFVYDEDGDPSHNPEDVTDDVTIEDKPGYPVDLGLPSGLLWSSTNIGAEEIYEYGDYYAWGETKDKASYTAETYDFPYEKDYLKPHSICAGKNDVASQKWGGDWRLPTETDFKELMDQCKWTWAKIHEVTGYLVTGPNGNSIFFPTAGNMYDDKVYSNGTGGCYWTGTCHEFKKDESDTNTYRDDMSDEEYDALMEKREAVRFHFHAGAYGNYVGNCYFGRSVRPVTPTASK